KRPTMAHDTVEAAPMRILIIDDDRSVLDSMKLLLRIEGHSVVTASNGREGVELFHAALDGERFDLVITDLGMPFMDGHEVARNIKKAAPDTPVILFTGSGRRLPDDNANVDQTLNKPPNVQDLRNAVVRWGRPKATASAARSA